MVIKEEMAGLVKAGCEGARLIHGLTNQSNVLLEGMSLNKQKFLVRQLQLLALNNSEIKSFFTRTCSCPPVAFKYLKIVDSTSTTVQSYRN
jgi:hypothetical protein